MLSEQETDWELIDESAAGMENTSEAKIRIYPNPVTNQLFIDNNLLNIDRITIADMNSRKTLVQAGNINRVDVSALSEGMYFISIFIEGQNSPVILKLVKN